MASERMPQDEHIALLQNGENGSQEFDEEYILSAGTSLLAVLCRFHLLTTYTLRSIQTTASSVVSTRRSLVGPHMGVGSRGRHRCHRRDRAALHVPHHEHRLRRPQHRRARLRQPVSRPRHPLQLGPDQVVQDRPHPEHPPCRRAGVPRPPEGARARRTARPVQQGLRDALPT